MPELPEVETIARGVDKRIRGDRIVQVWFGHHTQPFKTPRTRQIKGLSGRSILAVHRTGKHIVFELGPSAPASKTKGNGAVPRADASAAPDAHEREALRPSAQWIVHLGMTGRLLVTSPESPVAPHTHARLFLESGRELRFVDPRRFGRLEFRDLHRASGHSARRARSLSLSASRSLPHSSAAGSLSIKAALLNQTLLAGVGNIYADESLFHAGIRPRRRANRVDARRARAAAAGIARNSHARHSVRRIFGFRLRRRRRRARLFSAGALCLPAHRRALPPLPNAHSQNRRSWPRNPLLSEMPALSRGRNFTAPAPPLCFFEEFSPFDSSNSDNNDRIPLAQIIATNNVANGTSIATSISASDEWAAQSIERGLIRTGHPAEQPPTSGP